MSLAEKQGNRNSESNLRKISLGANNESQMKQNTLNEGKGNKLGSELWLAREGKATTIPHNPHSVDNVSMMLAI